MQAKLLLQSILIFLFFPSSLLQQIGFTYPPNPDVIQCGNFFYYVRSSSPTQTYYASPTGSATLQGYLVRNGILESKDGNLNPQSCVNETIESLWIRNKAFRIFDQDQQPNLSFLNSYPDVVKCGDDIMFFNSNLLGSNYYLSSYGAKSMTRSSLTISGGAQCDGQSINSLKTNKQTFNIVSQKPTTQGPSIYSMSGDKYPDAVQCGTGYFFYLSSISDQSVDYRGFGTGASETVYFQPNGNFKKIDGITTGGCNGKTISQLYTDNKVIYLNTPVINCPSDITSDNQVVQFKFIAPPGFDIVSSHASNSQFPFGKTTTVTAQATNSNNVRLSCTFGVTIKPDKIAPKVICPQDIKQKNPLVSYAASATDNDALNQVKISYDKDPNTQFPYGEITTVSVTATDNSGNQATCTFKEQDSESQSSNLGLIIGAVVAGVAIIILIVVLLLCKKYKKACFKKKARLPQKVNFQKKAQEDFAQAKNVVPGTAERFDQ